MGKEKECILCHNLFIPKAWNSTICDNEHYKICEICGEKYKLNKKEKAKVQYERKTCYKPECIKAMKSQTKKKTTYHNKCILCGQEFETHQYNNVICPREHHRTCSICGEDFILKITKTHFNKLKERDYCYKPECITKHKMKLTKSNENWKKAVEENRTRDYFRKCSICGKYFTTSSPKRTYCYDKHYRTCKYCGEDFLIHLDDLGKNIRIKSRLERDYCYKPECVQKQLQNENKRLEYNKVLEEGSLQLISLNKSNFITLLNKNNIKVELNFQIEDQIYDFKLLDQNIVIDLDSSYTHNTTVGPILKTGHRGSLVKRDYHLNKTLIAMEHGYQCIHVWDWDDLNKIINLLVNKERIRGRKVELREISKEQADEFLDKYHIQEHCNGNIVNLGLFYNNELIEVTTFGKPRYSKYEWEWLRLASSNKYQVIGGIGKFWKYFQEKYKPDTIVTYIDNSKFGKDNFLNNFSFVLVTYGKPTPHWYNMINKTHYTNNLLLQRGADQLLGTNYGKPEVCGMNNKQVMVREGYVEVYDCGQSTWVWRKEGI